MFTGSDKDRRMIGHIQAEMRRQAAQEALAQAACAKGEASSNRRRWVVVAIVIVVAVLLLFTGYLRVYAQDAIDAGTSEPFADAMVAYRLGYYYLVTGDYEQAVVQLSEAVELMPEWAFVAEPAYADLYWTLGEAQEHLGLYEDALANYHQFLTLVGDDAAPWTVERVQQLERRVAAAHAEAVRE
jgi:tetratricopeptide (TPR) repeat protein